MNNELKKKTKKEMTNYEMLQIISEAKSLEQKRLPQRLAYVIMRNLRTLREEVIFYEQELEKLNQSYDKEEKLEKDASGHICLEANGLPKVKEQYAGEYEKELVELLGFTVEVDLFYLPEETLDYEDVKYDPLSLSQMRCVAALCMKE